MTGKVGAPFGNKNAKGRRNAVLWDAGYGSAIVSTAAHLDDNARQLLLTGKERTKRQIVASAAGAIIGGSIGFYRTK
jgi:hypothetical protein